MSRNDFVDYLKRNPDLRSVQVRFRRGEYTYSTEVFGARTCNLQYELAVGHILEAGGYARAKDATYAYQNIVKEKNKKNGDPLEALRQFIFSLGLRSTYDDVARQARVGTLTESQILDRLYTSTLNAFARSIGRSGPQAVRDFRGRVSRGTEAGLAWDQTLHELGAAASSLSSEILIRLAKARGEMNVPPEILGRLLKSRLKVRPEFMDLPRTSLLARVAFEADVFCKSLAGARPKLSKPIPGLKSWLQWEQTQENLPNHGRMWISPGRFEITESPDGRSIRFARTPMRFNLQKRVRADAPTVPDAGLDRYAAHLSGHYDALARQVPVLHELRECMKVLAVARWLQRKGFEVKLPSEGRAVWTPPREIDGHLYLALGPDEGPKPEAILTAAGGVDLTFKTPPTFTSGTVTLPAPDLRISPVARSNEQMKRIFADRPDVPLPEIPGWIKRADVGDKAMQQLTLLRDRLGSGADGAAALMVVDEAMAKAKMIQYYDRMINAMTDERVKSIRDLESIAIDAKKEMQLMADEALSTVTGGLAEIASAKVVLGKNPMFRGLPAKVTRWEKIALDTGRADARQMIKELKRLQAFQERVSKAQSAAADLKKAVEVWKRGTIKPEEVKEICERLQGIGAELIQDMEVLKKYDPKLVKRLFSRGAFWLNSGRSLIRMTQGTMHVLGMHQMTTELSDQMGDQAKLSEKIRKQHGRYVDEYLELRKFLKARLPN